jgi:transcriptional regulator with XRE-family HTH domain
LFYFLEEPYAGDILDICLEVGKRIRELRLQNGRTQEYLSGFADVSQPYLCRIEQGKKEVGLKTLQRIADALDVSIRDLLPMG